MYTGLYVIVRLPLIHIQLLFNYTNGCTHIKIHLTTCIHVPLEATVGLQNAPKQP